jgi:hypothetical protein
LTINVPDTGAAGPGVDAVPVEDDPQEATNSAAHSAANPVPSLTPRRIGDSFYTAREPTGQGYLAGPVFDLFARSRRFPG